MCKEAAYYSNVEDMCRDKNRPFSAAPCFRNYCEKHYEAVEGAKEFLRDFPRKLPPLPPFDTDASTS
jgi:hypothetical protein